MTLPTGSQNALTQAAQTKVERGELRRILRQRRRALTVAQQQLAARRLANHLLNLPLVKAARSIALYLPNDGEISLQPFIERLWGQGKTPYLPQLHPLRGGRLWFLPYRRKSLLRNNRFGIPEPRSQRVFLPRQMDVVLLPLVGFDAQGNRLGMGGGFYDRTFAQRGQRPVLIGVAHACQQVTQLPVQPWDVPLHGIVTDHGWMNTRFP
ncbi:MAG: 5-formyltetrahydrofolate cyclo-ligase [Natronospirillum sp.]